VKQASILQSEHSWFDPQPIAGTSHTSPGSMRRLTQNAISTTH
jgi:hypothetical protein